MPPLLLCKAHSLRAAKDVEELRRACADLVADSSHVRLRLDRLHVFEGVVRSAQASDWAWMFDPRSTSDEARLFDAAFNASLNGGYFFLDSAGKVKQWEVRGSGSQALLEWIAAVRERRMLPGHDFVERGQETETWLAALETSMEKQPYLPERREVLRQFADLGRRAALRDLASEVLADGGLTVELRHVDRLAEIYPAGLRADPLRKKAILAFLLLAGSVAARGRKVTWRAGFPVDYQLPRICAWKGVLEFSEEINQALRDPHRLMPIESEQVYHTRAATFVAIETLSQRTGVPTWLVDGALFLGCRKDPAFIREAPPPMRVGGSWF